MRRKGEWIAMIRRRSSRNSSIRRKERRWCTTWDIAWGEIGREEEGEWIAMIRRRSSSSIMRRRKKQKEEEEEEKHNMGCRLGEPWAKNNREKVL